MQILGIPLNKLSYKYFFENITRLDKRSIIFTPNPEIILKTLEDVEFKDILLKADYLLPDGTGLFIAFQIIDLKAIYPNSLILCLLSFVFLPYFVFNVIFRKKYIYTKYGDKICGSDLTTDLLKFANKENIKIAIIDLYNPNDEQKVASQKIFSEKLKEVYKNLNFDYIIYNESKKEEIIESIKNSDSKVLFSTLGMKKQEKSILDIMNSCDNIKIGTGIGSSFDYIIGFQKRAPNIWRYLGLEWLYRLATGPQKINRLKRLYRAIFIFIYKVITNK
ncbi:MAG: WecB/TagA/CpsF family glycosyltransferase [Candidatus Gracilibacteria bacterium]